MSGINEWTETERQATALREQAEEIEALKERDAELCRDVESCGIQRLELLARIAALEAENERLQADGIHTCHDHCQRTACVLRRRVAEVEAENDRLRADLQGAEQRAMMRLARYCDLQAMLCKYGQTAVEWAQRAEIVRHYARQRAGEALGDGVGGGIEEAR